MEERLPMPLKRVCSSISLKCFGITVYQWTIVEASSGFTFPNRSIEALLLMFVFTLFWVCCSGVTCLIAGRLDAEGGGGSSKTAEAM
jgi:hypothetical protein